MSKRNSSFSAAFVNTGKDSRLLDHLAPLASLLKLPLYLTEENNVELCEKFYPEVEAIYLSYEEFSLFHLAEKHSLLLQSTFWEKELIALLKNLYPNVRFGFAPHGNSDKGHLKPMLQNLMHQDLCFLYGEHMVDRLSLQNIKAPPHLFTGNYRLHYYLNKKKFFDSLIPTFNNSNPTILYAPSWNDEEGGTSFFNQVKKLIQSLPSSFNLIIKTHPLLEEMDPGLFYASLPEVQKQNLLLLSDFPAIFPLLNAADIYLGDASSIGYDFLYFQKPMFFFNPYENLSEDHPALLLYQAGVTIPNDEKKPFEYLKNHLHLFDEQKKEKQKELWEFAFGKTDFFTFNDLKKLYEETLNLSPN